MLKLDSTLGLKRMFASYPEGQKSIFSLLCTFWKVIIHFMLKVALIIVTTLLLFAGLSSASAATDCVVSRAYFEDKSAQMTFEQAKDQTYKPAGVMLAEGFSSSAFWLRLEVNPAICGRGDRETQRDRVLIVRIQPGCFLDEIQLFDPTYSQSNNRIVGDRYAWDANEYSSLNFNFKIPEGVSSRYIWLRLQTTSTTLMRAQVFNPQDITVVDRTQEFGFGLYICLLAIVFLWALGIWAVDRDRLVGVFVVNQLAALIHATLVMGYFKIFLSPFVTPHFSDLLSSVVILFFAFAIALFHFNFYRQFDSKKWINLFFIACMCLFPINLALLFLDHARLALNINLLGLWTLSFILLFIPFFGINWQKLKKPILSKYMLFAIYLLSNVLGWLNLLPALGYFSGNAFTPYTGLAYGLITGIIFLMLLQHRYRTTKEEKIFEVSQANANAQVERERREEQGKFLAMLTHELKTPLSVLRMGFNSRESFEKFEGHIDQAIMDMNNIIERCVMADKFDGRALNIIKEPCDISKVIKEISQVYETRAVLKIQGSPDFIVNTDAHLFRTILVNLIDNAVKYGKEGEPVVITVSSQIYGDQAWASVAVANRPGNAGMPDPKQVFSKYYRAPKAYERTGSGLGLYLIQNIAAALGAQLAYEPDADRVIFTLRIAMNGSIE
jgi:signal transduction histidine kinase